MMTHPLRVAGNLPLVAKQLPTNNYVHVSLVFVCTCVQVLVLGNKVDLPNALRERELIERM